MKISSVYLILENKLKLEKLTIHIAIEIYDAFAWNSSKNLLEKRNSKDLIILTIMLISAKYNERDEVLISFEDLQKEMGTHFSQRNLVASERKILKTLNWNLRLTTLMQYVQFYYSTGVIFSNDNFISKQNHKIGIKETKDMCKLSERLIRKCERFADLTIVQNITKRTETRLFGLACVLCARKACNIEPVFNENFRIFYNITQNQIEPYFMNVWRIYEIAKTPVVFMSCVDGDSSVHNNNAQFDKFKDNQHLKINDNDKWSLKPIWKKSNESLPSSIRFKPAKLKCSSSQEKNSFKQVLYINLYKLILNYRKIVLTVNSHFTKIIYRRKMLK